MRKSLLAAVTLVALIPFAGARAQNVNAQTGTTYTFANTDCSKLVTFSNASAIAATLPQASSASGGGAAAGTFLPPCRIEVINVGAGVVTITPTTSTVGGASTLVLTTGQSDVIVSDGANYQVEPGAAGLAGFAANGSVATTMTSLGPTGSHTTVQEWMTVNHGGTTRYIPLY